MEERRKDWASIFSEGPSKVPSINGSGNSSTGAWGVAHVANRFHGSNDTSLFSSSLPVLPHKKLNLGETDEAVDPLEDVEPTAIGGVLPDEDELFAGIMDGLDLPGLPSQLEELEEYDIFGSGGGMELEVNPQESLTMGMSNINLSDGISANFTGQFALPNGVGTVGEHPYGEHPSRTLFVRNINSNVEDSELKSLFEQYGDIRTLYTACKHRGFVMISYFDIRDARTAMRALQNKPLRRRKLDIHFSIPKDNPSEKDVNQGTLVVFNLDASVSNDDLRQIFGAYGEVKEIRETPHKKHHKFIEFYDVRAAEAALRALNRCDIAGKRIKVEPSRPGGARRNLIQQLNPEMEQDDLRIFRHQVGSPITNSPPGSWAQFASPVDPNPLQAYSKSPGLGPLSPVNSNDMSGLASILPPHISGSPKIAPIGKDHGRLNNQLFDNKVGPMPGMPYHRSQPLSEAGFGASPGFTSSLGETNSLSSSIATLSGSQFLWGSPPYSGHTSAWPVSSVRHHSSISSGQGHLRSGHGYPYPSLLNPQQPHHVGSAPSGAPIDRRFGLFPESPELGGGFGLSGSKGSYMMGIGPNGSLTDHGSSPSFTMMPNSRQHGSVFLGNGSFAGPGAGSFEVTEQGRIRRADASGSQMDSKKLYQLDLGKIVNGEDTRTTLMIKNIPNKYTSKMLLAVIDESHRGIYDFLYLPIDFKNKCNVGYAFINMVSPSHIVSFYKTFNGKRWEKFNSEKVASLAFARIQGKAALINHFQNSSLMNEDKRCRPILFHSEGQDLTDQEYLLSGNLNICVRQADGSYSGDSLDSPKHHFDENADDY